MMDKIINYFSGESRFYTVLFCLLGIGGWFWNALYGSKFNLTDLATIYGFIITHLTIRRGIDSKYNSKEGEEPK